MRVLVISAHPDDETLGCGGTLPKHLSDGDQLYWTIVTSTFEPKWSGEIIEAKLAEVRRVQEAYQFEECCQLGFQSTRLDTLSQSDIIESIRESISHARPEVVYVVHGGDVHTDHQQVFTASMSVLKPLLLADIGVRRVLCYETLSSTEAAPPILNGAFVPNVSSDIIGLYKTEIQPDLSPRAASAIQALARYRDATNGVEYAEAFMLVRELV